jgi:organic hydroperoxide reductase OsmC/OhrA
MASSNTRHTFACDLIWTGGASTSTTSYEAYSRDFEVRFEGKPPLRGSAASAFRGNPSLHNPEDLLVAALAACHCLSYLALCARTGVVVRAYEDTAVGVLERAAGTLKFADVLLRPVVTLATGSDVERALSLHTRAHAECFIANSMNFPVRNAPEIRLGEGASP